MTEHLTNVLKKGIERGRERERWCLANWDARGIDQKTEALSCPSLVVGFAHSPLSVRSISQLGQIGGWILVPRLTRRNLSNSPQLDVQLRLFSFPPPIYIIFFRSKETRIMYFEKVRTSLGVPLLVSEERKKVYDRIIILGLKKLDQVVIWRWFGLDWNGDNGSIK